MYSWNMQLYPTVYPPFAPHNSPLQLGYMGGYNGHRGVGCSRRYRGGHRAPAIHSSNQHTETDTNRNSCHDGRRHGLSVRISYACIRLISAWLLKMFMLACCRANIPPMGGHRDIAILCGILRLWYCIFYGMPQISYHIIINVRKIN